MSHSRTHRATRHLGVILVLLLAPFLMQQMPPGELKNAPKVPLNPLWEHAGVVMGQSLGKLVGAVACPGETNNDNCLVAVDSSGTVTELRFVAGEWTQAHQFKVGHTASTVCPGAPQHDRRWRIYVGSNDGQITELTRGTSGWTTKPVIKLDDPIVDIHASDPGMQNVSQLVVIDGGGHATNLWIGMNQDWVTRPIPDIKGGITDIIFDRNRQGLFVVAAGPEGSLYQYAQDTMGFWSGDEWAKMSSGVLDMAPSVDPMNKDRAIYYAGLDGNFRYLFFEHKTDSLTRVPIAFGVNDLIGKQPELRYNEFMALSNGEYCQFEFSHTSRRWERTPLYRVGEDVAGVNFGLARPGNRSTFYVTTADGKIHEFVRQTGPIEDEADH